MKWADFWRFGQRVVSYSTLTTSDSRVDGNERCGQAQMDNVVGAIGPSSYVFLAATSVVFVVFFFFVFVLVLVFLSEPGPSFTHFVGNRRFPNAERRARRTITIAYYRYRAASRWDDIDGADTSRVKNGWTPHARTERII